MKRILIDGGYIEGGVYYFYPTDHLDNNRVVANATGTPIQKNHYYPFGTPFAETAKDEQGKQPYKYNGKEYQQMHQLNLYDYSARQMDGIRFTSIDPLAEKYYSISPYVYVANNPLTFIDPDGRKLKIANNSAGAMENVAKIAATSLGRKVLDRLIGVNETYNLKSTFWSSSSQYDYHSRDINYVGSPWYSEVPVDGGSLTSLTAMGHETFHTYDHSNNTGGLLSVTQK